MTITFAVLTLVLGLARLSMFIALRVVPSGYNIVEHAVSDYAVGPTKRLSSIMTWTTAAFWLALAAATLSEFSDWNDAASVSIRLVALAIIFVVLPFLPTDLEGSKATTIGRLHLVAAVAWFALSYSCMSNFTDLLQPQLSALLGSVLVVTGWIAEVSLVALVVALVIRPLRRRAFGIAERVFLVSVNVFYLTVAGGILVLQF